jgi:25S rRNA (uracil2843-N3)-methyltransferase
MTYRSRAGGPLNGRRKNKVKSDGPKKLHHPPSSTQPSSEGESSSHPALGEPSDETILDILHQALDSTLTSPDLRSTIQKIKGLLYESKWLEVFTDEGLLEAYAGRWVPSRALCFRELMVYLEEVREFFLGKDLVGEEEADEESEEEDEGDKLENGEKLRIISLGGGAGSELIAVASLLGFHKSRKGKEKAVDWIGADIGKWSPLLDKFTSSLQTNLSLSQLSTQYIEGDILSPKSPLPQYLHITSTSPTLVTLLFTLTELLTQSPAATISFLRDLTSRIPKGGLFLIADSASDIASFSLGSERKWPTYTIIDLVLTKMLRLEEGENGAQWRLISGEDSRWFRMGEGVGADWPVKLENTRYWYRLYRRL